jgi:AcrR family transcriptional regulator
MATSKRSAASGRRPTNGRTEEMMMAALELFARRDVASVTIKDIARALKVNTALIYYYFDSKDDLFRACLRYCIDRTQENFRRLEGRHDDPVKLISAWFETHAQMYGQIRQLVKVMLDYVASGTRTKGTDVVVEEFYEHETRMLADSIRLGVKLGVFAPVDVRQAALFASTHLDGIMVRSFIQKQVDVPAAIRTLEKVFFRYLKKQRG